MSRAAWLPFALLLAYGVAFAAHALGVGPLASDDHPGQLARLWHVLRAGPAPWAWNDGWWAGYPELQFYPPGWFYAAAALSWLMAGAVPPTAIYQALLWVTYLAPGIGAFALLRFLLDDQAPGRGGWAALPGALLVLAFTGDPAGGSASGVDGGVHIGMVGARLAWALLPLLALSLARWIEGAARFPRIAIVLLAAIVLTHPTHVPAALAILAAAVLAAQAPRSAIVPTVLATLLALALTAFWLLPLVAHLAETRALAWGRLALPSLATPFAGVLVGLALVAGSCRRRGARALRHAVWLAALAVALDALVVEPLGVRFLPADRVADGAWMTLLLASGLGAGIVVQAAARRLAQPITALAVIAALVAFAWPAGALTLWPRSAEWPSLDSVMRGLRIEDLWRALRAAPPGRVLFVRSGVPLVYGTAWYRAHTHVTALTPVLADRDIIGGTFTHGSPVAAFVYRGDTRRAPIARLAEQLDGVSLFGRPLDTLDAGTLAAYAARFHVAAVIAVEDDAARLPFLTDNPRYRRLTLPPFLVFVAVEPPRPPRRLADGSRELDLRASGWQSTGIGYSPLWRAERDRRALPARRGAEGDLEISADAGTVRLMYAPGVIELVGVLVSAAALAGLAIDVWLTFRRGDRGATASDAGG